MASTWTTRPCGPARSHRAFHHHWRNGFSSWIGRPALRVGSSTCWRSRSGRRCSANSIGAKRRPIDAVRRLDDWYSTELKSLYREIDVRAPAAESEVIAWHRGELAGMLADSAALVITGGHVGMLLRTLRLFALPISDELPVIAWSAGAMALTSRVVLFHDYAPQGSHEAEVYDRGLGRVPGVIALPHARRRLRLDDRVRCAVLARRFPDHRLLLLDDGTSAVFGTGGEPVAEPAGTAYGLLPHGVRVLTDDGVVQEVGAA